MPLEPRGRRRSMSTRNSRPLASYTYPRILSFVLDHPWAVTRPMLTMIAGILSRHLAGDAQSDPVALDVRTPEPTPAAPGVAILPIHGVIAPRMNLMSDI